MNRNPYPDFMAPPSCSYSNQRYFEGNRSERATSVCSSSLEVMDEGYLNNWILKSELLEKNKCEEFQEIFELRRRLPVIQHCREILKAIRRHQVVLLVGGQSCGKTTQIPQMVLDDFIFNNCGSECRIACVQTERPNASSAAEHVAYERLESLGNSIGLQVAGEINMPRETGYILYCTAQILIGRFKNDPLLKTFTCVILDDIQDQCPEYNQLMDNLRNEYHVFFVHAMPQSSMSKASSLSTIYDDAIQQNINNDDAITISDSASSVVTNVVRVQQDNYRKSIAILSKYDGKDISQLSKREKKLINKHRKRVELFEKVHPSARAEIIPDYAFPTGASFAAKIKHRRLSSICPSSELQVAIVDRSNPQGRISDEKWYNLEEMLIREMTSNKWTERGISFEGANWSRGIKIIKCGNSQSLQFLKTNIANVCQNWPYNHLEIIPYSNLPPRIFARMWIPPPVPPTSAILTLIEKQNKGIETSNWKILSCKPSRRNLGTDYRMFIDANSSKKLQESQGRIKYGLNFIRIVVANKL
ncbi:uncharacterized protein LOC131803434 isoform X2 [Musca domestica]|uniref:Uncharacterized protein LOC131803434 isoform X2 n=1 Tax=Musca domestica TaxID=7370 RepID=A0ABM3V4K0_MUSDO|nr:uncharacterized protein LOC131803434 isoform X2 [Musca domestica]